jgi:hypothetical protein
MSNKIINLKPKYNPGDIVYAISIESELNNDGKPRDEWSKNYSKIYKVEVDSIQISRSGIEYWLRELKGALRDRDWGDSVPEEQISKSKEQLINYLLKLWKI